MLTILQKASQREQADLLRAAADRLRPSLRRAFLDAVAQVKDEVVLAQVTARLEAGDTEGAADILLGNMPGILVGSGVAVGMTVFSDQWRRAHDAGAQAGLKALPEGKARAATYDPLSPRSVNTVREYSAALVREVSESTRAGIVTALEETAALGMGPVKQARRVRELIGLTEQQTKAVVNFRDQLEQRRNAPLDTAGNPRPMKQADTRRLSATERAVVRRHLKQGTLTDEQINAMVNRYYTSLLNRRAQNIARTESMTAASMGQNEAWQQAQEQGILSTEVRRKWVYTHDSRTRDAHASVPGMNPGGVALGQPFQTPLGPMDFPRDPKGTAKNRINCRCAVVLVNP
jgi:hypothetical protein